MQCLLKKTVSTVVTERNGILMKVTPLAIPDVVLIEPHVYSDDRGFFFESFNQCGFEQAVGRTARFIQDNHSCSAKNVLRGLHYQINKPQGKLVRVVVGEVFDVAVDIRRSSPTYGKWVGEILSAENKRQIWIPEGFAHGFLVLSSHAEFLYKATEYWAPEHERCIAWNDTTLAISWPTMGDPTLSVKDSRGSTFEAAEVFA